MRIALKIAYNGVKFFGSQIQNQTQPTVMGTLQHALQHLGINTKIVASGRTDKGVHATAQICHIDLPPYWNDLVKLHDRLDMILPSSIEVKKIWRVDTTFHARYSAKKRTYRYLITTKKPNPFYADFISYIPNADFLALQKKIQLFEGEHDFCNFIKTGSDEKSTIRIIYRAFAYKYHDIIVLHFEANGFLRTQIRFMVAALLELDKEQLEAKLKNTKSIALKPAPPNGLYLAKISY